MYFPPLGNIEVENQHLKKYQFVGGFEEDSSVSLWYRKNGKREIIEVPNVPHYFCISKEQFQSIPPKLIKQWKTDKLFESGKIVGGYAYFYRYGKLYKNQLDEWLTQMDDLGYKPLEGDVSRLARLMIDLELNVAPPGENGPMVVGFDIETDDRQDKIIVGGERILSISFKDYDTGKKHFDVCEADTDEAEKDFLERVMKYIVTYDVAVGYNNYGFDDEYLKLRFARYGLDLKRLKKISTLDTFNLFERQGTFRKYKVHNRKLDTIAKAVLGRGKLEHKEKIYDLWANNRELLQKYNEEDVELIFDMEQKLKSVALILSVCSQAGLLHSFGYSPAKCIDTFILRQAVRRRKEGVSDFRYPTQYFRPEHKIGSVSPYARNALSADKRKGRAEILLEDFDIDYQSVEGAYVIDAVPGLYPKVIFSDFNSLYPNHIIANNIGVDTKLNGNFDKYPHNTAPNGVKYRTDIQSGMAATVEHLLGTRAEIRKQIENVQDVIVLKGMDLRQNSVKELANSTYGVAAQWGGRYYDREIAESITASGRYYLPYAQKWFAERGRKVIAGDTDSFAVAYEDGDNPEEMTDAFVLDLRKHLKEEFNCYKPERLKMSVEPDKTFTPMLVLAKKNYVGKKPDGEISITGLQAKKGNVPAWSSKICVDVLEKVLSQKYNCEYFERYVQRRKEELETGKIPLEDFFISARLSKDVDSYESQLPHLRVAKRLIDAGHHIPTYTTITYVITNILEEIVYVDETITNKKGAEVVKKRKKTSKYIHGLADLEIQDEVMIDAQHYWNMILMPQLQKYLTIVFPEKDWDEFLYPRNLKRTPFEMKVMVKRVNL